MRRPVMMLAARPADWTLVAVLSAILFVLGPEADRTLLGGRFGAGAAALWVPDARDRTPILAGAGTARFQLH